MFQVNRWKEYSIKQKNDIIKILSTIQQYGVTKS